jgi:hypothetical protein
MDVNKLFREPPTRIVNGFHVVDLPADSPAVTTEDVRRLENGPPPECACHRPDS